MTFGPIATYMSLKGVMAGMVGRHRGQKERDALQIECLACGTARVVPGTAAGETGECPRCRYRGWDYSDDLDGTTLRQAASLRRAP